MRDLRETLSELKTGMARVEAILPSLATQAAVGRIEAMLAATLPHLATKAELAEKPSKTYLWGILGVLVTTLLGAFAATLAAVSILH